MVTIPARVCPTLGCVSTLGDVLKRLAVGRPMRSAQLGEQLLPKKIALPVFASDALSSVAYATEEILLVLSAGGLTYIHYTWYAAAAVAYRLDRVDLPDPAGPRIRVLVP